MLGYQLAAYLFFVVLCQAFQIFEAAKILGIFPYESPAQCILLSPYLHALAERGHDLTVIHAYDLCATMYNINYIRVHDEHDLYGDFNEDDFRPTSNKWREFNLVKKFRAKVALNLLLNKRVQQLLHSNATFDLVVVDVTQVDPLYGFGAHFNASLMGFATCGSDWNMDSMVGYPVSSIEEPKRPIVIAQNSTLLEQLYMWFNSAEEWLLMKLIFLPMMRKLHEQFFPHLNKSFAEIGRSFSLILLNQHFSLGQPRPNVPGLVEVAGIHLPQQVPALPQDLEKFIDQSKHGVIYFALGIELQGRDLPFEVLSMLLETFESLPQRVIWKYEGPVRRNVSSSIYISPWLPQQAILAHSNVRLFITHGGILSIIETAYYAKPILGFPLFFDQFRNIKRLLVEGVGLSLDLNTLTKPVLSAAITQIVNNSQYHRNALALSQRFRDQPMHPLDTAVYWTEYVIRYKGAAHMRVAATNIKFIDYYNLDKVLIVFFRLALIVTLVIFALYNIRRYWSMIL